MVYSEEDAISMVNGSTLEMGADVLPVDAADPDVDWSVATLAGGTATINSDELLTATGVGTVTVTATAHDGSSVAGTKVITITAASGTYTIAVATNVDVTAAPTASPAGGTYTSNQSVSLSTATSGATIFYTTDGSTPTSSSAMYSSALSISGATTLKAIAVKSGMTDSSVMTEAYNVKVTTNTSTLSFSASNKAKKKINLTFNGLSLTKKKWVKVRLNGRKVTVARVRRSGNNSIVAISFKYKKWAVGNYNLSMTYKNQTKVPYTTKKGKTKYRKGWESGNVTSDNILSII